MLKYIFNNVLVILVLFLFQRFRNQRFNSTRTIIDHVLLNNTNVKIK